MDSKEIVSDHKAPVDWAKKKGYFYQTAIAALSLTLYGLFSHVIEGDYAAEHFQSIQVVAESIPVKEVDSDVTLCTPSLGWNRDLLI